MLTHLKSAFNTIYPPRKPLAFLASDVDGYGNFGDELTKELRLAAARPAAPQKQSAEIEPEDFESVYRWFLS
jgi:hypothetical protein